MFRTVLLPVAGKMINIIYRTITVNAFSSFFSSLCFVVGRCDSRTIGKNYFPAFVMQLQSWNLQARIKYHHSSVDECQVLLISCFVLV
ncbi:MAG TPA: hypothetical protein VFL47_11350 [Flavisolibacter sp.]|nr:hypothetical protein [Flavisolibacter sp.]